jgi:AAA15 family ATPase/GTPase
MRILDRLSIENYGVLKKADFEGLKDLNIIIGPNNCGKTTVLRSILKLGEMDNADKVACSLCQDAINGQNPRVVNPKRIRINDDEKYLKGKKVKISFYLNEDGINSIKPNMLDEAKQALAQNK